MQLDKKSNILFIVLLILVVFSIYLTYRRAFVTRDFEIYQSEETGEVSETKELLLDENLGATEGEEI